MTEPPIDFQVPSDKDAIASTPAGDGQHILVSANCYAVNPRVEGDGALLEETSAFRSDVELFYDLHTLIWDPETGGTLDVRDDAVDSDVDWTSGRVPEIHLHNEFEFADGTTATLDQYVVVSVDRCSMTVRNEVDFERRGDRTLYTLLNLGIKGHDHEDPNAVHEAQVRCTPDHDVILADDDTRFLAMAQDHDGDRSFDGYRVGTTGQHDGRERSAWADIYRENDGWIDPAIAGSGDLDAGVGLFVPDADTSSGRRQSGSPTAPNRRLSTTRSTHWTPATRPTGKLSRTRGRRGTRRSRRTRPAARRSTTATSAR
ncbi:hypothetical protein [Halapricum sp. CBA1109]|uniref:hypothetical protein n=1 Tax=Halapricum sp. CBA1109 TaxID=2668068 RepID=UPI0018D22FE2|nr:hypothetical protein [Halapricum sp. CBA1109]